MASVVRDWRLQLREALPEFFATGRGSRRSGPVLPDCGEGWCCVVDRLCVRIAAALEEGESFRFESIGQRDGALRVRWAGRLSAASEAAVRSAVDLAEARSMCVCELCGARGQLYRADGVLATRCPAHAEGTPARSPAMTNVHLIHVTVKGRLRVIVGARYHFDSDSFVEIDDVASLRAEA
ncbi:hypothetical protein [Bradyrhizobium yuanmingense]|uniref:hypothetical protein n=1 Tax=Bradyrhizobium yuanmingense TaxID=108015 RepID=UPI001CD3D716|nr:hypothetical protein [Bradyrhizobium yuanmingense]MCA1529455.1 hypothetical protein [Bradyrhizobium yuanmingense]